MKLVSFSIYSSLLLLSLLDLFSCKTQTERTKNYLLMEEPKRYKVVESGAGIGGMSNYVYKIKDFSFVIFDVKSLKIEHRLNILQTNWLTTRFSNSDFYQLKDALYRGIWFEYKIGILFYD